MQVTANRYGIHRIELVSYSNISNRESSYVCSSSRMRRADIEVPNRIVDVNSWMRSACYPRGNFCPLSDGLSMQDHRITKPYFRTCSTCQSCSQAPFCLYTLRAISVRAEGTFGRLCYSFGGDRPSQTARLTRSCALLMRQLELQ